MTVWKKAMNYLGLGPDDVYDDYYVPEPVPTARQPRGYPPEPEPTGVRTIPQKGAVPRGYPSDVDQPAVTVRGTKQASAVRTVSGSGGKPHTVRPRRFDQAQEVADKFREGNAVIVNLQDVDKDLSRRLIDFASGLCYGLGGTMEKAASGVYLLTPANVSVSAEDRRMLSERDDV